MADFIGVTLNVQHYDDLGGYGWIADFQKAGKLVGLIDKARADLKKLRGAPLTNAELKARLSTAFDDHRRERLEYLRRFIDGNRTTKNLFTRLALLNDQPSMKRFQELISWEDIADAVDGMPEPDGAMPEKKKAAALAGLEKRLEKLEADLAAFPDHQKWVEFASFWRDQQGKVNAPISPMGFPLHLSPPVEQKAHKALNVHGAVNKTGMDPNPNRANYRITAWPAD